MLIAQILSVFALGLIVGSFLNVCIHRLPKDEFFKASRSFCPLCGSSIAWYDNIPLLSYAALRGRCRHCRKPISPVYPLVELLSGLIWVGFFWLFLTRGLHPGVYMVYVVLGSALLVGTITDLKLRIIPNEITVAGVLIAPIASAAVPQLHDSPSILSACVFTGTEYSTIVAEQVIPRADAFVASIFSIIVGGGSIYLLGVLGKLLFKKDAMGGGDVKLMAMVGGLLGWKMVLVTFFIAPFIAIPFGIVSLAITKDHAIPYGPFLSAATLVVIIWQGPIFMWFASLLG